MEVFRGVYNYCHLLPPENLRPPCYMQHSARHGLATCCTRLFWGSTVSLCYQIGICAFGICFCISDWQTPTVQLFLSKPHTALSTSLHDSKIPSLRKHGAIAERSYLYTSSLRILYLHATKNQFCRSAIQSVIVPARYQQPPGQSCQGKKRQLRWLLWTLHLPPSVCPKPGQSSTFSHQKLQKPVLIW